MCRYYENIVWHKCVIYVYENMTCGVRTQNEFAINMNSVKVKILLMNI